MKRSASVFYVFFKAKQSYLGCRKCIQVLVFYFAAEPQEVALAIGVDITSWFAANCRHPLMREGQRLRLSMGCSPKSDIQNKY